MDYELDQSPIVQPQVIVREGIPRKVVQPGEDAELLAKTKHVRFAKETMYEFYARTGIDAHFLRHATTREIYDRVALVMNPEHPNVADRESIYVFETVETDNKGGFLRRFLGKFLAYEPKARPRRPIIVDTGM